MSCGVTKCPSCGEPGEYIDPREAPINKVKLKALGDLLPEFEKLAIVSANAGAPTIPVTDQQLLGFLIRNKLLSEQLIDTVKSAAREIHLSSKSAIRSRTTRQAFECLLRSLRETRTVYDDLQSVSLPDQFGDLHLFLQATFRAVLDLHLWTARAVLVTTIEEAQTAQQEIQIALDRAAEGAHALDSELGRIDPESLSTSVSQRLSLFTGIPAQYEHDGRPDLAPTLASRSGESNWTNSVASLGQIGASFFRQTISVDPTTLSPEHALTLYLLAAETAASEDALTIRRRAAVYLEILNHAFQSNPSHMLATVTAAEDDLAEALVTLLSLGDTFRALKPDQLPREAYRLTLIQANGTLTEWVFARLISILLNAKFVLNGQPKPYTDTSARIFNEKFNILDQEARSADPRYAVALLGVATIARNAGAHGGIRLSGEKIHLTQRDKKGKVTEVEMTDDEFSDRLSDLLVTCQALSLAMELFRILHHDQLSPLRARDESRLLIEGGRALVGLWALHRAEIEIDYEASLVAVQASLQSETLVSDPTEYLPCVVMLALLFRPWSVVQLTVVGADDEQQCRVALPTEEAQAFSELPEEAHALGAIKVIYRAQIEPTAIDEAQRYRQLWITSAARLVAQEIASLQPLRARLPQTRGDYVAAVERVLRNLKFLRDMLRSFEPPPPIARERNRLLEGIRLLRRGLTTHLELMRTGKPAIVLRASPVLQHGAEIVSDLME